MFYDTFDYLFISQAIIIQNYVHKIEIPYSKTFLYQRFYIIIDHKIYVPGYLEVKYITFKLIYYSLKNTYLNYDMSQLFK